MHLEERFADAALRAIDLSILFLDASPVELPPPRAEGYGLSILFLDAS